MTINDYDSVVFRSLYTLMRVKDHEFDGEAVAKKCREHLILLKQLGIEALVAGTHQRHGFVAWAWKPKFHLFSHFETEVASSGSPMKSWCYGDESSVGEAVHLAESGHASTIHRLVIVKRRLA